MGKKMRKNFVFNSLENPVSLVVKTKSPQKWLLVDRENGTVYEGNDSGAWNRLDPVVKSFGDDDANI